MTTVHMDPRLRARRIEVLRVRGRRRLRWLLLGFVIALVALVAWWLLVRSPFLDVDDVVVDGADKTLVQTVLEVSGIELGQPLLEVDMSGARTAIAALPWVLDVTSDRSATGEVTFVLTERVPLAAVAAVDGWLLVDRSGRVLESVSVLPAGMLVLAGLSDTGEPGSWLGDGALPALDVAGLLPVGLAAKVAGISSAEGGLQLDLFGGGRVLLGDETDLESKFLAALTLLVRVDIACLDNVDVRAPAVPVLTRLTDCP